MQTIYYTKKGSRYICQSRPEGTVWYKRGRDGTFQPLAGAIHLPRTRLQELLREYPRAVLDTTVCFGNGLAQEFFDDARREHRADIPDGTETNIFFLQSRGENKYIIGYSSTVERIETAESAHPAVKLG